MGDVAEVADPRASRVVLIGGSGYQHLSDLPGVAENVSGLTQVLTDPALWGVPKENLDALIDPPDPQAVGRTLRAAAAGVRDNGLLLVYYAGHGVIDPSDGSLILALPQTEPEAPHEAGLPYEWVRRAVAQSRARRRVVILDCCYAGRASSEMAARVTGTDVVADRAEIDETCLLVSAPRNRPASAPPDERYTTFTGELLRVLRDGVPGAGRILDIEEVWREVRRVLLSRGHERPELRERNSGGSIPLVRNAAIHQHQLAGGILVAAPQLTDVDLRRSAVLVLRHEPSTGAVAVRITTPTDRLSSDIRDGWRPLLSDPAVVFDGGPVAQDGFIAVALLRPNATAPLHFTPVRDRLGTVPLSVPPETLRPAVTGVRLFSGYLGWGPGELESYLDNGLLLPANQPPRAVLSSRPRDLWPLLQHDS